MRFTGFTLLWFVLFFFSLFLIAAIAQSNAVLPFFGSYDTLVVTVLLMIVLSYFAYMTYSIPQWRALRHGLKRFWPLFLLYLASVGITALFLGLSSTIFTVHWSLLLIFIVAILIPSFTIYKVGFVTIATEEFQSVQENDKKKENK
ncbi:hypothetical protein GF342_01025 [Candidatus Woesearchaeota archaeon]|nr:hypothetical protein [Candidatus Woesearchaeota archaeon]